MKRKGGFERFTIDDYTITREGEVINNRWNRKVKPQPNGMGYLRVSIGGKLMFVHRLVAEQYIPNPEHKAQVNHIDGNPRNNRVENLEWVTQEENMAHAIRAGLQPIHEKHPNAKMNWNKVNYIREHSEISRNELAKMFGVSPTTISSIRLCRTWTV